MVTVPEGSRAVNDKQNDNGQQTKPKQALMFTDVTSLEKYSNICPHKLCIYFKCIQNILIMNQYIYKSNYITQCLLIFIFFLELDKISNFIF